MLDNLYNSSEYGQYLREGAAISYKELQNRINYVHMQLAQQQIANGLDATQYNASQSVAAAQHYSSAVQTQTNYAINYSNSAIDRINSAQDTANAVYNSTNNIYNSNLLNMRAALQVTQMGTSTAVTAASGAVRNSFGGGAIIVDTGTAKDLSIQAAQGAYDRGMQQYQGQVTQIQNTINAQAQAAITNSAQNISYDAQKYLVNLNLQRSLNGGTDGTTT